MCMRDESVMSYYIIPQTQQFWVLRHASFQGYLCVYVCVCMYVCICVCVCVCVSGDRGSHTVMVATYRMYVYECVCGDRGSHTVMVATYRGYGRTLDSSRCESDWSG